MPESDDSFEAKLQQDAEQLQAQMDKLATYAATLRRQEGRLGELNYRYNSHIRLTFSEQQERVDLPKQLRETRKAFRQEFPGVPATPNGIDKAIRADKSVLADIKILQENQERLSHLRDTRPTEEGWRELVEAAARRLAPKGVETELQNSPPQHTPHKRPLRDLYTPDAEPPRQEPEQDHGPQR
jgi:hypothetical protein